MGQIPKHMEEEDLRPVFEEFGEIFDLAVIRDKISGLHRGKRLVGVRLRSVAAGRNKFNSLCIDKRLFFTTTLAPLG